MGRTVYHDTRLYAFPSNEVIVIRRPHHIRSGTGIALKHSAKSETIPIFLVGIIDLALAWCPRGTAR